ncbi:acetyltransferase [Candidatus Halobeggiatoa sp. HSG11]|nr:acetyltransferase [Candidatus Halobeggiatoa sp. HSG11]
MKIIIYGNGAMARVVYSYIRHNMEVCGFTVDDSCINQNNFCELPLIPFSKVEYQFSPKIYKMLIAVGFVDMNELRNIKYQEAKHKGYQFVSYVHDSVFQHDDMLIAENCIILDFVSIHPGTTVGHSTFISSNTNIGHDCNIDHSNWINSGVAIAGSCQIGSGCFFGVNSSVGNDINIGNQNFIAANTFISKNTKDNEVYLSEVGQHLKMQSKRFLKFSSALK